MEARSLGDCEREWPETRRWSCRIVTLEEARAQIQGGKLTVAAVIPKGFGDQSAKALFRGTNKPEVAFSVRPAPRTRAELADGASMPDAARDGVGMPRSHRQFAECEGVEQKRHLRLFVPAKNKRLRPD